MSKKKQTLLICLFLSAATFTAFWRINDSDFIPIYDDARYVTDNSVVQNGFAVEGIRWAFTTLHAEFWHPLTWLSHMLDVQLFGLEPWGHHLMNLLLHIANTLLLFLVFHRMTKSLWQSAFVGALFALHPLHVESVAWVAERKDVLSTFFWMLTMGAYVYYVELPGLQRFLALLLCFGLGLMVKPTLVTLPFVLLLLDYWPLRRFAQKKSVREIRAESNKPEAGDRRKGKSRRERPAETAKTESPPHDKYQWTWIRPLLLEKIPLFTLTALASVVAYMAQKGGAAGFMENFPPGDRMANAFISYIRYIGKIIWPVNLTVFYPYVELRPSWQVLGAVLLFVAATLMVIRVAKSLPYLAVGWLWYAGTLVPVIGIVQVGGHAMADRYTYIPLIGLFIMVAWGFPELMKGWRYRKEMLFLSSLLSLSWLSLATWTQVGYWKNSVTLFEHAFQVTGHNSTVYNNRGNAYASLGNYTQAIEDLQKAIELNPRYVEAYNNRGYVYMKLGDYRQAIEDLQKAIELNPKYAEAYNNRGNAYAQLGNYGQAIEDLQKAIELNPKYALAYNNRAFIHGTLGDYRQAIEDLQKAIELNPRFAEAYNNRGNAYAQLGNYGRAIEDYDQALKINPKYAGAYNNRAAAYWGRGDHKKGMEDLKTAARLGSKNAQNSLRSQGIGW